MLSEKPWRIEVLLRLAAGLLASISFGVLLAQGLNLLFPGLAESKMRSFFLGTLTFHAVALGLVRWFLREHETSWKEAFGFNRPNWGRAIALGSLTTILILPVAMTLSNLSGRLMEATRLKVEAQPAVQALQTSEGLGQQIYFGCVAILLAPFVEEIIFRGILYPFIRQNSGRWTALLFTSALFALSHTNLLTFLPLIVIGLALALLYEKTDNLLASISAHSLFNAINFALLLYNPQ